MLRKGRPSGAINFIGWAFPPGMRVSQPKLIVEYTVEQSPHMETVQIVLDKTLLRQADRAARLKKQNRSALVRDALREHLRRLEIAAQEERDRRGHLNKPQERGDAIQWEGEAVWPAE
jgi:predicted transcriptional regulator